MSTHSASEFRFPTPHMVATVPPARTSRSAHPQPATFAPPALPPRLPLPASRPLPAPPAARFPPASHASHASHAALAADYANYADAASAALAAADYAAYAAADPDTELAVQLKSLRAWRVR